MTTPTWMAQAACKGKTDIFFSQSHTKGQTREDRVNIEKAKVICSTCSVIKECRSLLYNEPFGVIAGMTSQERGFTQREQQIGRKRNLKRLQEKG